MNATENRDVYKMTAADLARIETLINLLGDAVFEIFQLRKSKGPEEDIPQPTFQEFDFLEEHFRAIHDLEKYF